MLTIFPLSANSEFLFQSVLEARAADGQDQQFDPEQAEPLQKVERHAAIETLNKLRQMTWNQVYRDSGLKWEKIISIKPPNGIDAIYSLRITQARRATAYREGEFICLLTIASDHDSTYGKK